MWMMDDQSAVDSSSGLAIPCRLCSLTCTHLFLVFIANYLSERTDSTQTMSNRRILWSGGWGLE